tara:strand:+ start:60708 stop:60992 length:285 start_codon:yes stop_codon:yes gene_type:complete
MFKRNLLSLTIIFTLCEKRGADSYYGASEESYWPLARLEDEDDAFCEISETDEEMLYIDDSAYERREKIDRRGAYKLPNAERQYLKTQPKLGTI